MAEADNTNLMNLGTAPALPAAGEPAALPPAAPPEAPADPVAAEREALQALTKAQLANRAADLKIKVAPNANKDALVEAILTCTPDEGEDEKPKLTRAEAWARVDDSRTAGVVPNLSGFDLSGVDFTTPQHKRRNENGKTVTDTILIGMDFHGVNLSNTNLEGTVFINGNLQGCTFSGAEGTPVLDGADIRWGVNAPAGWNAEGMKK